MPKTLSTVLALTLALSPALRAEDDGEALVNKSGCLACHKVDRKMVGPAYKEVAKKYKGKAGAVATLVKKVKQGGSGNWGTVPMQAHPNLSEADIEKMVRWVLTTENYKPKAAAPAPAPAVKAEATGAEVQAKADEKVTAKKKKKKHSTHAVAHGHGHGKPALDFDSEKGIKEALKGQDCFGCHSGVNRMGGEEEFVWPSFAKIQKRGGDRAALVKKVHAGAGTLRWGSVPHPRYEHLKEAQVGKLVDAVLDGTWAKGEAKAKTLAEMSGEEWMKNSDCFTCHDVKLKKAGPSYAEVAKRYAGADAAQIKVLVKKVKDGGQGNWNMGSAMTPHKDVPDAVVEKAVRWVLEQK